MEVLVDGWGYMITLDKATRELDRLGEESLVGEILSCQDTPPFNVPSGKQLTLRIDPNIDSRHIEVDYHPSDADWDHINRVDVRITPDEYQEIYFGSGRVLGVTPDVSTNIRIEG
jgi:hypothetical protein